MSALSGFRVVELAESVAGEFCGKLLADLGAEVLKVEPPGGSPTRAMAPLLADGPDGSALFAYLNTNKCFVTGDASAWVTSADAVVSEHLPEDVRAGVVYCAVSPFGAAAPVEYANAKSLNVFHASGWGHHTPSHADPATPPLQGPGRHLADYEAGLDAALCVAASLFRQLHTGAGQRIDVSAQAVLVSRADCILGRFVTGEIAPGNGRDDFDQQGPAAFFACADGFVYLYMTSRAHWSGLKALMGRPPWLDDYDDDWLEFSVTAEKVSTFRDGFTAWVRDLSKETVADDAQRHGVPLVPVNDPADLAGLPQYRHRGFFQDVVHPVLGAAAYPTAPYRLSATPVELRCGARTTDIANHLRPKAVASQHKSPNRPRGGPLEGVRVVALTKVWAGPYACKLLAFLGAEVIKVENAAMPEEMRAYGGTDIDHAPFFLSINPEILSVNLDLKTATDLQRLKDLIARSDIVVNNLRPHAMERLGLGYPQLCELKSDIISVSVKMWGNDGPLGHQTGYAPCFAALSGMASLVGRPGGPPLGASMRYGDSTVGAAAAFAAVAALLHRDVSGEGQFVDVSAVETLSMMVGDSLVEHGLSGRRPGPDGNRHPDLAPHGCYPCGDGWVSIAVADDAEWQRLCETLGIAANPRHATHASRCADADALDACLARVTRSHNAEDLAARLRQAGVAAAKSATASDVIADRQLWDRDAYLFVSDRVEGQRPVLGPSWRMSAGARIERGAPDLGEDDDYVLGEVLGVRP